MKKRVLIYTIIIFITTVVIFICQSKYPNDEIIINKPTDIANIFVDDDYYKNDMKVEYITSYPIDSNKNLMKGDGFLKGYHKTNTMLVFKIKDSKNLSNILKSVKLKKGKYNIGTKSMAYQYGDDIMLFITIDTFVNDVENYSIEFTIQDKNKKDLVFLKRYSKGSIESNEVIKADNVTKINDESFFITLTKKSEIKGNKYDGFIELEYPIKIFNFGKDASMDIPNIYIRDSKGKLISSKYKVKAELKGDYKEIGEKILLIKIKINSTDTDEIKYISDLIEKGSITIK